MKTNKQGKIIKYLITELGIQVIDEDHPEFNDDCAPIFETFEESVLVAIESLYYRVKKLEKSRS